MISNLDDIKERSYADLCQIAITLGIDHPDCIEREDLLMAIFKKVMVNQTMTATGVVDILPDGFGFLRFQESNYLPSAQDVYISPQHIKEFRLRKGDTVEGTLCVPGRDDRFLSLHTVKKINLSDDFKKLRQRAAFDRLTPTFPDRRMQIEPLDVALNSKAQEKDMTLRTTELIAPLGFGQRALIVAPPRTGKTIFIQTLIQSIMHRHPEAFVMVLLIDERPEEVTDMKKVVTRGEVISSTFDQPASNHVKVAEMAVEKAKRLVEMGKDVVLFLDSMTRLARGYNAVAPSSGKVLTGGVDSNALQKPKRLFGAARNLQEGGSLSIIASALVDTGSRMDEVIFEEFKGTGNAEIVLDRKLADKRIFPALDVMRSGTRREELLVSEAILKKLHLLRRVMSSMSTVDAAEFLIEKVQSTKNNADFFDTMNRPIG